MLLTQRGDTSGSSNLQRLTNGIEDGAQIFVDLATVGKLDAITSEVPLVQLGTGGFMANG